jgi:hypothetical protein
VPGHPDNNAKVTCYCVASGKDMNFIESERSGRTVAVQVVRILVLSILLKLGYLVFAYIVQSNVSTISPGEYVKLIQRNDSGWYEIIARNWYPEITDKEDLGYSKGADFKQSEWAFFPLYPGLNRMLMLMTGLGFGVTGLVYSLLFASLAFTGFYWFCLIFSNDHGKSFYYTLLLMIFPFHFYFSMMYTEAVYFSFLILAFVSIHKKKYLLLPMLLIPLVLVRPNGIISLVPLYLYFLERENVLNEKKFHYRLLLSRKIILNSLLFLTGPAAFIVYGFYQEAMTGYFFAFSIAQAGWYREFMLPFMAFFRRGDWVTQFNSFYTIIFILLAVFTWKKFPFSLNVLIWIGLLLPLFSGSVTSMPRFISVIFPFMILFGDWLYNSRLKVVAPVILVMLHFVVFYFWITGHPFSC